MIRIQRTTEPKVLAKNKASWKTRYLKAVAVYNTNKSVQNKRNKENAEGKFNQSRIKSALKDMCFGKCAYCESHIPHISYGHIEHYKPKSKYPELCFEWNNLLLGCEICNGPKYKGDKFPLIREGGPFINPCDEDPDIFFEFEFDPATGTANVIPKNRRGKITEKGLGLNRSDLVTHRSQVVRKLAFFTLRAKDGDVDALAELKRCMKEDQEYAAFARTFHRIFNLP